MGGATERDLTGAKGGIDDDAKAPIGPDGDRLIPLEDDSGTMPTTPRSLMISLTKAIGDPHCIGDLRLARVVAKLLSHVLDANERGG